MQESILSIPYTFKTSDPTHKDLSEEELIKLGNSLVKQAIKVEAHNVEPDIYNKYYRSEDESDYLQNDQQEKLKRYINKISIQSNESNQIMKRFSVKKSNKSKK